jgi:bifunctional DNA-binding transcriptional regulator/antitoxin component of YhaV-PrlF toxin-antitoxin module
MTSRVTNKLQVAVPQAIANRYGITPGQEIEWQQAGDAIRVVPRSTPRHTLDRRARLEMFDQATARQLARQSARQTDGDEDDGRDWTREDLYECRPSGDRSPLP